MFWDTAHRSKIKFFRQLNKHLKPAGRAYFAWADFKDLDVSLPFRLAEAEGFGISKIVREKMDDGYSFYVFEIMPGRRQIR